MKSFKLKTLNNFKCKLTFKTLRHSHVGVGDAIDNIECGSVCFKDCLLYSLMTVTTDLKEKRMYNNIQALNWNIYGYHFEGKFDVLDIFLNEVDMRVHSKHQELLNTIVNEVNRFKTLQYTDENFKLLEEFSENSKNTYIDTVFK